MSSIYKYVPKKITLATFILIFASAFLMSIFTTQQNVSAWCENIDNDSEASAIKWCTDDNKRQALEAGYSEDQYNKAVSACNEGTSPGDKGHRAQCTNAALTCLKYMSNKSNCENHDQIDGIRVNCNQGMLTGDHKCDEIAVANATDIRNFDNATDKRVVEACKKAKTMSDQECDLRYGEGSKEDLEKLQRDCAIKGGLGGENRQSPDASWGGGDGSNQGHVAFDQKAYEKCVNDSVNRSVGGQSKEMCDSLGGFWVDKNNTLVKDDKFHYPNDPPGACMNGYSDLTNPEACAASGTDNRNTGVWAQEPGKTGQDGWGCYDPSKVCKKDSGYTINDRAPCKEAPKTPADPDDTTPNRTVNFHAKEDFETCGTASVNLLSCSDAADGACPGSGRGQPFEGVQVLGCVLKIGLQALTVLVGIGAVGGIAYSSFRYASASDNAGAVTEAKGRIRDIVIGLIVYVFLLAVVQWLVPGLVMDTGISSSGTPAAQASP